MFGEFRHFSVRILMLQSQTRLCGQSAYSHVCSKVSVKARTFSRQVHFYTSHRVHENQRTQAFCAYATFIHEAPAHLENEASKEDCGPTPPTLDTLFQPLPYGRRLRSIRAHPPHATKTVSSHLLASLTRPRTHTDFNT